MNFFRKVVCLGKSMIAKVQSGYVAAAAAVGIALGGAVPAHADLATDLGAVTTTATTGLATVSTNQVSIMQAVFGLIIFAIGFGWLVSSMRKK